MIIFSIPFIQVVASFRKWVSSRNIALSCVKKQVFCYTTLDHYVKHKCISNYFFLDKRGQRLALLEPKIP